MFNQKISVLLCNSGREMKFMYPALDISKYVISKCTVDNYPISNLQLQKILYYIQKEFLIHGGCAFPEDFEAWQFGPVVPGVYEKYCGFGALPIRVKYNIKIDAKYMMIINPIVERKRTLNPWDMVNDTHSSGKAWDLVYNGGLGNHKIISKKLIKNKG